MTPRRRALIVSSDSVQRDEIALAILPSGYEVIASDGFADAKRILEDAPDLLVTDIRLGAYNGLHLVIRGCCRNPQLRAIVVGDADPVLELEALRAHAVYVQRPLAAAKLVDAISTTMSAATAGRRRQRKRIWPTVVYANDVKGTLMDVSYDGARLALPRRVNHLPRSFVLRVPSCDVTLDATWIWMSAQDGAVRQQVLYGLRFSPASPHDFADWRSFVDAAAIAQPRES